MNQLVKIAAVLGTIFGTQSAITSPLYAQVSPESNTPNQMIQLLQDWGFETIECQDNVIKIQHDVTGEIGCAVPNETIQAGAFMYNSADNTLSPIITQQSSSSEAPSPTSNQPSDAATTEAQNAKARKFVFDFDNAYDYSACLDVILLMYEGRNSELENVPKNECADNVLNTFGTNLAKDPALKLIESANVHATENLDNPLYPVFGIRRRVAINLGYVYGIDENNSDILELVSSKSQ